MIYVAGPFRAATPWQVEKNVRKAERYSLYLWSMGIPNICPHTMGRFFDGEINDQNILLGMKIILRRCDAVLVVGDYKESEGTKAEIAEAESLGMPVFETVAACAEWVYSNA